MLSGKGVRHAVLALVVAMIAVLVAALPGSAYQPSAGALFNAPRHFGTTAQHYTLMRHVDGAINNTRKTVNDKKPVILISTYLLDRKRSVTELIDACKRGVSVRVIIDHDIESRQASRLIRALNADNVKDRNHDGKPDQPADSGRCGRPLKRHGKVIATPTMSRAQVLGSVQLPTAASVTWGRDKSYVKRCDGSCRGAGGNMHSKFYAFSHTGRAHNVVIISSANLNHGGALLGWNDMYTMRNRPKSYAAYNTIHREMTEDSKAGDGKVQISDGPFVSRFFPMRNASKRNDPTLKDLNKIGCHGPLGATKIYVSMFYWAGTRGQYLATKLLNLARNGCQVNVIYGAPSRAVASRLRDAAKAHLINLWDSRWDFNKDGYVDIRTHAKYVAVKGRYGSHAAWWQVMTGSQNWVAGSLSRSDELTLNIGLRSAYGAYVKNWNRIRVHSHRLPYSIYGHPTTTTTTTP